MSRPGFLKAWELVPPPRILTVLGQEGVDDAAVQVTLTRFAAQIALKNGASKQHFIACCGESWEQTLRDIERIQNGS